MENTRCTNVTQVHLTKQAKAKISPRKFRPFYQGRKLAHIHIAYRKLERDIV